MELEWVSGWEPVGGSGEILMGIRSGGGWMPEGFLWDVSVKYRWMSKENMERCQREIWWNAREKHGGMPKENMMGCQRKI